MLDGFVGIYLDVIFQAAAGLDSCGIYEYGLPYRVS